MAAKPKTTKLARELDENGRIEAKRKFLHDEMEIAQIASRMHVAVSYLLRLSRDEGWDDQLTKLCCSREYVEAHDKAKKALADCQVRIEVIHAKTAVHRARAQHAVAKGLAEEAAAATTPKQVHELARALGPASQDITSGRLAVGLTTEKTESQSQGENFASAMDRIFGPAKKSADNRPDAPAVVEAPPKEAPADGTPTG